jgi:tetratricopeptide (TPR) repeat protein
MSLLLEALKKAEKAKEEAQRRADDGAAGAEAEAAQPDAESAIAQPSRPVMTRDQLPEISQPLEIVNNELQLAPEPPKPQPQARPEPRAADSQSAERAAGRKVFEAKFREPNPRLPFFVTMGALGAFAVGTMIYFYIQLRPPPSLVNLNPPRPAEEATAAASPAATQAAKPIAGTAPSAIPGLPGAPAPAAAAPVAQAPAATPAVAPPRRQVPAVPPPARPVARAETPLIRQAPQAAAPVEPTPRAAPAVHPKVQAGYAAYQTGDLGAARREYEQALAEEPSSRDALLGVAALDVRAGRFEAAEASYLRLLQADPRDAHAHAALVALRGGRQDPLVAESRVKSLLAADPGAHVLNFALGNQFAQQGRWAEAQQQFFKAAAAEPDNADFAYNLAVSFDHLRQSRPALEHYQRAIALAEKRGASFDLAAARARVAQLGK